MHAIVLKSTPYEDDGKILKIFTKDLGVISVIVKNLIKKGSYLQTLTSPLALGEFHLIKRQSDLYVLKEATLIDGYFEIRQDLKKLEAACIILKSLLKSQFLEKSSDALFQLTTSYLRKMKTLKNPTTLALSFQLKLLNFEGLYPEKKEDLSSPFSEIEWLTAECLCHAKKFETLENLEIDAELEIKICSLFEERILDYN